MRSRISLAVAAAMAMSLAGGAIAQTKWDLPTAYPATNFHTENIAQFAKEVRARPRAASS